MFEVVPVNLLWPELLFLSDINELKGSLPLLKIIETVFWASHFSISFKGFGTSSILCPFI